MYHNGVSGIDIRANDEERPVLRRRNVGTTLALELSIIVASSGSSGQHLEVEYQIWSQKNTIFSWTVHNRYIRLPSHLVDAEYQQQKYCHFKTVQHTLTELEILVWGLPKNCLNLRRSLWKSWCTETASLPSRSSSCSLGTSDAPDVSLLRMINLARAS